MAKYREIKGVTIQTRKVDPTVNAGTWSSQSGMNEGRKGLSGFGTYTAAIAATGNDPSTVNSVESWNGSSWTEIAEVNTAKFYRGNNGTQTAGLLIGGAPATTDTEEWNGSAWTETADYPAALSGIIQLGTQTAAFAIGGATAPGPYVTSTNTYNGSSFTSSTAINTARSNGIGSGSTTAAVIAGGSIPSATANTEVWNGSSWTESSGDLNTARDLLAGSGSSSTNSLAFGGLSTAVTSTESWNGTSWTEVNDLATGRRELGGSTNGSNTQALAFSGCTSPGAVQTATEQWTFPSGPHLSEGDIFLSGDASLKAFGKAAGIPSGVFVSVGALNTPRERFGGTTSTGGSTAAIGAGGDSPVIDSVEQYNGSSWSEITELNTARGGNGGGAGTTTAMLAYSGGPSIVDNVESWNGSAWTEITEVNTGRYESKGGGTQTAALFYPGYLPPPSTARTNFEEWNGSSWTELAEVNRGRSGPGAGTTSPTSAVIFGGSNPPPVPSPTPADASTETWDGSSWTEVNEMNTGRGGAASFGNATSCIAASGYSGGFISNTEKWDGTNWTEVNELGTSRSNASGSGSAVAGLVFGGNPQPGTGTLTEEWSVESQLSKVTVS